MGDKHCTCSHIIASVLNTSSVLPLVILTVLHPHSVSLHLYFLLQSIFPLFLVFPLLSLLLPYHHFPSCPSFPLLAPSCPSSFSFLLPPCPLLPLLLPPSCPLLPLLLPLLGPPPPSPFLPPPVPPPSPFSSPPCPLLPFLLPLLGPSCPSSFSYPPLLPLLLPLLAPLLPLLLPLLGPSCPSSSLPPGPLLLPISFSRPSLVREIYGGNQGLLRCGKGSTWDGGQRVPGIARWPGKIRTGKTFEVGQDQSGL